MQNSHFYCFNNSKNKDMYMVYFKLFFLKLEGAASSILFEKLIKMALIGKSQFFNDFTNSHFDYAIIYFLLTLVCSLKCIAA